MCVYFGNDYTFAVFKSIDHIHRLSALNYKTLWGLTTHIFSILHLTNNDFSKTGDEYRYFLNSLLPKQSSSYVKSQFVYLTAIN